jgi:hypothetical protein
MVLEKVIIRTNKENKKISILFDTEEKTIEMEFPKQDAKMFIDMLSSCYMTLEE